MSEPEQNWIEQLNRRAKQYRDAGMDSYGAIAQAAADFKMSVLVEGDVCRIYEAPDGILVNCLIDENGSSQAKDRPGFDDSIQWYTQEKTDGKE
ncbi:MAG: hypothetical protein QME21_04250 [Anaerolineales bacterium]|jgi:hypothetical protein|nr:hypothetical protein [Anaerolineales bacterium]